MPGALLSTSAGPRSPLSALAILPRGQRAPNVRLALLLWQVPATCKHCFLHIIFSDCLQWEGWCTISEPAVTESGNPPRGIYIGKCDELGTENWVGKTTTTTTGNENILEDKIAWQEETLDGGSALSLFPSHMLSLDLRAFEVN